MSGSGGAPAADGVPGGHGALGRDGVLACALADARFHELALAALGLPVHVPDGGPGGNGGPGRTAMTEAAGLWWTDRVVAPFFMSAGTLSARTGSAAVLAAVAQVPEVVQVRDCWAVLDLSPAGFVPERDDPWMVRPPGPVTVPPVPGLVIHRAATPADVREFERTAVLGTGDPAPDWFRPGDLHPATTPTDGDLHLFTGLLDGRPVATALAAVHPDVVMVGAVRTHPQARRRGIGTALTAAVVAVAPDRPAALGARPLGVPVYRGLGFEVCGRAVLWTRPGRP